MGVRSIKMPDVGEGVAEAEIVEWAVKVGDLVREDQVVASVMTDKATVEIPTPVAGSVLALGGAVGDVLAVGAELADHHLVAAIVPIGRAVDPGVDEAAVAKDRAGGPRCECGKEGCVDAFASSSAASWPLSRTRFFFRSRTTAGAERAI